MKTLIFIFAFTLGTLSFAQTNNTLNGDNVADTLFSYDGINIHGNSITGTTFYLGWGGTIIFKPTIVAEGEGPDVGQGLDTPFDTLVVNIDFYWENKNANGFLTLNIDDTEIEKKENLGSNISKVSFTNIKIPEDMDSIWFYTTGWGLFSKVIFTKASPTITAIAEEVSSVESNDFAIYPNPIDAGQEMSIQLSPAMNANISGVDILAASGDVVASFSSIEELTTTNLTQGIYFIMLKSNDGMMKTNKLIVR